MEEVTRCHDQIRRTRALRRIGDEQLAAARVADGKVHAVSLDPPPNPRKYLPAGAPVIFDPRRQPMRLSALFEEFCHFLRVEKGATPATIATYRWCFGDFLAFVMKHVGGPALLTHFTEDTCRSYQYDLANRELKTGTIRLRVATLGSFGKWMVRRDKVVRNPVDRLTRPRRKARVPAVPAWHAVMALLDRRTLRERAMRAPMALRGLRRGGGAAPRPADGDLPFRPPLR